MDDALSSEYALIIVRSQIAIGKTHNARRRAILLRTAALTAAADFGFRGIEHHMTDLSACTMCAADDLSIQYDASADARAQRCHHHGPAACAAALPAFAQCSNIGVVAALHRKAGQAGELAMQIHHAPA